MVYIISPRFTNICFSRRHKNTFKIRFINDLITSVSFTESHYSCHKKLLLSFINCINSILYSFILQICILIDCRFLPNLITFISSSITFGIKLKYLEIFSAIFYILFHFKDYVFKQLI